MEEIITANEAAAMLKVHLRTIYRLAEEGIIPGNRIGRGWRFNESDLLKLISNRNKKKSSPRKRPRK